MQLYFIRHRITTKLKQDTNDHLCSNNNYKSNNQQQPSNTKEVQTVFSV